jgi:hypothetical protein
MPYVVRYLRARSPQRPYLARVKTGEWGTSVRDRAERFATRLQAEKAIGIYIDQQPAFALDAHARKLFVLDAVDDSGQDIPKKIQPARTIWERILEDD